MSVHTFSCLDGHTCGNPVRLVSGGGPLLKGATMSERRLDFLANHDWIRKALMFEPRGHDVMSGSILYPPTRADCDIGILFIEVSGCLPMCGHGTIGTVTMAVENGLVAPATPGVLNIDAPAGRVVARYEQKDRFVESVRITNVASYLAATDVTVDVPGIGELTFDIAYGGNYYAILEPQKNFAGLEFDVGRRRAAPVADRAPAGQREDPAGPSRERDDPRREPRHVDRQAARPARPCPQRGVLRRQGDRPVPLRHRHVGAHGPARRQGPAQGRRRLRAREHHRLAVRRPRRGLGAGSATTRRSCRRSPAGRASTASTPSSSTTATPSPTASRSLGFCRPERRSAAKDRGALLCRTAILAIRWRRTGKRLRFLAQADRPAATRRAQENPVAGVSGNAAAGT